jgi:hypothetical protein
MVLNPPDDTVITRQPLAEAIVATFACREAKGIVSRCLFSGPQNRVFRPTSSGGGNTARVPPRSNLGDTRERSVVLALLLLAVAQQCDQRVRRRR